MKILKNKKIEEVLFIDIETVRLVDKLEEGTPLYDSFEYKMRYTSEKDKFGQDVALPDLYEQKAPLYAVFGKICCVTLGRVDSGEFKMRSYFGKDEAELLTKLAKDLETFQSKMRNMTLCGHTIKTFDMPFIAKRCIVNQIDIPECIDICDKKPWDINMLDISDLWKGTSFFPDSLIGIAVALGIPSPKSDINGADVSDVYYKENNLERIKDYCERDVKTTYEIYKKMAYIK